MSLARRGGAAVVTVAPAASAAVVTKTFTQGSMKIATGARESAARQAFKHRRRGSADSSLAELKEGEALSATSVSFGVEIIELPRDKSSLDVKVRVYRYPIGRRG